MNDDRRKLLQTAIDKLAEAHALLDQATQEEQEYHDNMPEGIQDGPKGDRAQEVADEILNIQSDIEDLQGQIEELKT